MTNFVEISGQVLWVAGLASLPLFLIPVAALLLPSQMKTIANGISGLIDRVTGWFLSVAMFAAILIILLQLAAVILRYVFGISPSWLVDSVLFCFAIIFMLGAAGTLREDGHVRVDILRPKMSAKVKATIELLGAYLFIFPICILIIYAASGMVSRSWITLEPFNEGDGLPVKYLFKTLVPMFAILLMAQGLSQAIKAAQILRGQRGPDKQDQLEAM